jgi:hypothetical protein
MDEIKAIFNNLVPSGESRKWWNLSTPVQSMLIMSIMIKLFYIIIIWFSRNIKRE